MRKLMLTVTMLGIGCGGGDGGGGAATADQACADYFNAFIDVYAACVGASPAQIKDLFGDISKTSPTCSDVGKSVAAGRATYSSSQMAACIIATKALTCDELDASVTPPACRQALVGK